MLDRQLKSHKVLAVFSQGSRGLCIVTVEGCPLIGPQRASFAKNVCITRFIKNDLFWHRYGRLVKTYGKKKGRLVDHEKLSKQDVKSRSRMPLKWGRLVGDASLDYACIHLTSAS